MEMRRGLDYTVGMALRIRFAPGLRWGLLTFLTALFALGCTSETGDPMGDGGDGTETCTYPLFDLPPGPGEIFPDLAWSGILAADGSEMDLDLAEFYCNPEYLPEYDSLMVVVSAGWCSACPDYVRYANEVAPQLEAAGTLLMFVEVETAEFSPATSQDTANYLTSVLQGAPFNGGLRIGEADSTGGLNLRGLVSQFPSGYFVRRRDMVIVADESASQFRLDMPALAADPEQDWEPSLPPFVANCGPEDEEAGEPNDDLASATPIAIDEEIPGGVCAEASDFYRVDHEGRWVFSMVQQLFTSENPAARNLDLRLYTLDGERVGGSNALANIDSVAFEGPAIVEVFGDGRTSGLYEARLVVDLRD
jgi:hypothetical protein